MASNTSDGIVRPCIYLPVGKVYTPGCKLIRYTHADVSACGRPGRTVALQSSTK